MAGTLQVPSSLAKCGTEFDKSSLTSRSCKLTSASRPCRRLGNLVLQESRNVNNVRLLTRRPLSCCCKVGLMRNIRRLVGAAVIAVVCGAGWFGWSAYPLSSSGSQIAIRVSPGESVAQVATSLQEAGVLRSALAFRVDTMIFGAPLIRDGYYVIHKNASHGEIRRVLSSTPNAHVVTLSLIHI